jgi:hypothetical protein
MAWEVGLRNGISLLRNLDMFTGEKHQHQRTFHQRISHTYSRRPIFEHVAQTKPIRLLEATNIYSNQLTLNRYQAFGLSSGTVPTRLINRLVSS